MPTTMVGLPHDDCSGMTVQHGGDDAAINEPKSVVVLGPGYKLSERYVTFSITTKMEPLRVGVTATKALYFWVRAVLGCSMYFEMCSSSQRPSCRSRGRTYGCENPM